jgi:hypothetical protein
MSLEDKIISPMAPAELPGQRSEPLPKSGKKRRKNGGNAGVALGKAKKDDLDDEVGADSTAVLTLGASDEARRPQKKMLFESASDGATLAFAAPTIRPKTVPVPAAAKIEPAAPKAEPVAPAARASQPAPAKPASEPAAPIAAATKVEPVAPAARAPQPAPAKPAEPAAPIAAATKVEPAAPAARAPQPAPAKPAPEPVASPPAAKAAETASTPPAPQAQAEDIAPASAVKPVFQVASLAKREPEPQPEPKDEAQAELALAVDPIPVAVEVAAPAPEAKIEEHFHESLTLAFDATLAEGLAERSAAAAKEVASEPAPTPSLAPLPAALKTPEPAPAAAIETAARVEPQPAPAAIEPPLAPTYVAPVAAAPKIEPKPESETPNRALSRSEMIARAARQSARPAARPTPTAAETLAAARTAQQQLRSADLPKNPGDIYGYWTRVKNGRRFPSRADFDAEQVAEHWPNSMLLTCGTAIGAGTHGSFSSVLRMGANRRTRPGDDLNFTSMITEWILATGGEAARAGTPVQDTEVFPTPDGTHAYKIVALPLSENQTRVDHVLCHLSRS